MKFKMRDEINSMDISNKMMGMTTTLLLTKPLAMQKFNPAAGVGHQSYRSHLTSASSDISAEEPANDECEEEEDEDSRASSTITVGNCGGDDNEGRRRIVLKEKAKVKLASDDINLPSPPSSNGSPYNNNEAAVGDSFVSGEELHNGAVNNHNNNHDQPLDSCASDDGNDSIAADESADSAASNNAQPAESVEAAAAEEGDDVKLLAEYLVTTVCDEVSDTGLLPPPAVPSSADESAWESLEINFEGETILPNGVRLYQGTADVPFLRSAEEDSQQPPVFTNQLNFLKLVLTKHICRLKTAAAFLEPVDSMLLKIPHYYKLVRNPMDLATIRNRINFLWYRSASECIADIRQMFNNCYYFNAPTDKVYQSGKRLEEVLNEKLKDMPEPEVEVDCPAKPSMEEYNKIIEKRYAKKQRSVSVDSNGSNIFTGFATAAVGAGNVTPVSLGPPIKMLTRSERGVMVRKPSKDLPVPISTPQAKPTVKKVPLNNSMKFCLELVRELFTKKHAEYTWPFWEPVSITDYPDYLSIIKKPMDLSKIRTNIETGRYSSVNEFAHDVRLMISNCLRYNKQDSPIIAQARKLREIFEYRYALIPEEFLVERLPVPRGSGGGGSNSGNVTPSASNRHFSTSSSANATPLFDGKSFKFFTPNSITMEPSKSKKNKLKHKDGRGSSKHGKRHSHDGATGLEHISPLATLNSGSGGLPESAEEAERRMKFLENQVQRLTNALAQVVNNAGTLATLNGAAAAVAAVAEQQPPVRRGRKPGRKPGSTNKTSGVTPSPRGRKPKSANSVGGGGKVRARAEKRRHLSSDEDSDDDEGAGIVMAPFDPKSVTDLRKLKTDLENLKAKDLQNVLRILQSCEASVTTDSESNVEIDFEKLKPKTLVDLRNYVNSVMRNQESPSASHAAAAAGAIASSSAGAAAAGQSNHSTTNKRMRGSTDCDNPTVPAWSRTDSRTSNVPLSEESSSEDSEMDE